MYSQLIIICVRMYYDFKAGVTPAPGNIRRLMTLYLELNLRYEERGVGVERGVLVCVSQPETQLKYICIYIVKKFDEAPPQTALRYESMKPM